MERKTGMDFLDNAGASGRLLLNTPGLKVTEPEPCDLVLVAPCPGLPSSDLLWWDGRL